MPTMEEWALRYYEAGWNIFPAKNKSPLYDALEAWDRKWKWLETERPTKQIIEWWWKKFPDAQIALVCGKISGVTVIDIDTTTDRDKWPDWVIEPVSKIFCEDIGISVCSVTGSGGRHVVCKYASIQNSTKDIHPQLDIKSDGGYVILPESIHNKTKNPYIWDVLFPFDEENIKPRNLLAVPGWIKDKSKTLKKENDWEDIIERTGEGRRHDSITKLTGKLIWSFPPEQVMTLVMAWNKSLPKPEEEKKAITTIKSIIKAHFSKYGDTSLRRKK